MDSLNSAGRETFVTVVTCCAISVVAVSIRFWCKFVLKSGFHLDDWAILLALGAYMALAAIGIWGIIAGSGGKEMSELVRQMKLNPSLEEEHRISIYLESLELGSLLSWLVGFAVKMSICLFYRRIFETRSFRIASLVLMGLTTAWFLAVFIANIVHCLPVGSAWDLEHPGTCINFDIFFLAAGIIETLLDAAVLILPVRAVFTIQVPLRTKLLLSGVFLLGGFAVVTDILKVYYVYQPNAEYIDFTLGAFWIVVHIATAIVCACIPIYNPIRKYCGTLVGKLRSLSSRSIDSILHGPGSRMRSTNQASGIDQESSLGMQNLEIQQRKTWKVAQDSRSEQSETELELIPRADGARNIITITQDPRF